MAIGTCDICDKGNCEMEEAERKQKAFARISAVVRIAQELHDERDPECPTWFRKLEAFEGVFLADVDRIQRHYRHSRAMGLKDLGDCEAYQALCTFNYQTEADHLEAVLAEYNAERERFYNFDEDETSPIRSEPEMTEQEKLVRLKALNSNSPIVTRNIAKIERALQSEDTEFEQSRRHFETASWHS